MQLPSKSFTYRLCDDASEIAAVLLSLSQACYVVGDLAHVVMLRGAEE